MAVRVIVLANGKQIPLGAYARAWRTAMALPPDTVLKHGCCGWWPITAAEAVREFREGAADRINRHRPGYGVGRKWKSDWQSAVWRTARRVNQPRLRVYTSEVPLEFRARLGSRLSERWED